MQNLSVIPQNPEINFINRPALPQLNELTPQELLEQFVRLGEQIDLCLARHGALEELLNFQIELASVKNEIHRKANVPFKSPFQKAYFTLFLC